MSQNKIFKPAYRVRKAYSTAFGVMFGYVWLSFKSKFLGQSYFNKRVKALHLKNAEKVKNTILHLQGLFIKVGQTLSILTNFLPPEFHDPLEALQNKIPERPYSEIEQRIVKELGDKPMALFAEFNQTPIAAASIGQVHKATLKTGESVVVKVQHANIESIAEVDLRIIKRLVQLTVRYFKIQGLEHAFTQVQKMIEEELDYTKEAKSMVIIAENLIDEPKLIIPKIYPQYSTNRVMVQEYCEGVKIGETTQLKAWGLDQTDLANRLVHAYCKMVFEDGIYHADPHPGNILVQEDGTIVFLDFGAIGQLQPYMRTGFLALIDGAVKNDDEKIIKALNDMGFLAHTQDAEQTAEKIIEAFRDFLANEVQFEGLNLKEIKVNPFENSLFNLIKEFGISGIANTVQVPKDFVLLNRMVHLLLGICNTLDSNMNPINEVKPYLQKYILGEQGNMVQFITDLVKGNVTSLIALPNELNKTLKKVQRGEVELSNKSLDKQNKIIYVLGQQLLLSIFFISSLLFTYSFHLKGFRTERNYVLVVSVLLLFLLLKSMWRNRGLGK